MKGHGRGPVTSRNLRVMVKLHMVSVKKIKIVKEDFVSLRLVQFLVHLLTLLHDYISNTEQYS